MGCCPHPGLVEFTAESTISDNSAATDRNETKHQYTLNAMRSLEGVARIWQIHIEELESQTLNTYSNKKPSLKSTTSVPVDGNHNTIGISTYFFLKTPSALPNLINSHSSPNHKLIPNTHMNEPNKLNHIQESMDLDEDPDHKSDAFKPMDQVYKFDEHKFAINVQYNAENEYAFQPTPDSINGEKMPNINLNLMPVFSYSQSFGSPALNTPHFGMTPRFSLALTPLSLKDNDSGAIPFPETLNMKQRISMQNPMSLNKTYSENNIFALSGMGLNQNDFIEYETKNIGFGASGVVTKAFHFSSCKMVAIKHCRSKKNQEILAFTKEAELYKKFRNNKNIIDLIGFGNDDKNNCSMMALELMDLNSTYSLKINENFKDMKERELIVGYIALSVLKALDELHKNLYVHNDIKPENILSNKHGEVKLSDFGTMLQLKNSYEFLYQNNGTQKFQSPEKTTFKIQYNTKCDIWSLGITLYELLFGESDTDEISYTTNPPRLNESEHALSKNCCDFINQCLTIDQFERPSAEQLLKHSWVSMEIQTATNEAKWPWITNHIYNNEDLLFMISALILYYSTKKFNDENSGSIQGYHRRVSLKKHGREIFSDEQRIANIAKFAFCTKDYVIDRIKVTVSYIKSQLNKTQ